MTPRTLRLTPSRPPLTPFWRSLGPLLMLCLLALPWHTAIAQEEQALEQLIYSTLPGDRLQVVMRFSGPAPEPMSFTIDNPARIALDFQDTRNALAQRTQQINLGLTQSVNAVEAGGRTRVVFNLVRMMGYDIEREGNTLTLTLSPSGVPVAAPYTGTSVASALPSREAPVQRGDHPRSINNVDFRRGPEGEGRVIITLADPRTPVDIREQNNRIEVSFHRAHLPEALERRLDVTDFATPVQMIDTLRETDRVRITVTTSGDYDLLSYQSDNTYIVEVKPLSREEREALARERFTYVGERLSLNFQDIEIRSVLQLIADFTDLNVVVSDSVTGNITLRLRNVPWDQALDIILKTKGLAMRQAGNVIFVAPATEIAARERQELEAQQQVRELAPLRAEFIQVNYARAEDVAGIISGDRGRFMSERGSITVDNRTNTLLVQDTNEKLEQVRRLVNSLDIPVQQVLIETRIVIASDSFARELGARFGVTGARQRGNTIATTGGRLNAADNMIGSAMGNLNATGSAFPLGGFPDLNSRLNINLPTSEAATSGIGFSILRPDILLDLELLALQQEQRGEIVSSPRVITTNGQMARIEKGEEIPYKSVGTDGTPDVIFRDAKLITEVTPQITPNGNIILNIKVSKDSRGEITPDGFAINKNEVETQVFVRNGETVVLGGVYETANIRSSARTPLLGDIPVLGHLFRQQRSDSTKNELLIFVTPRVIEESTLNP
ncbi:type IV pilus assembly protein PilQ [Ectothiorhodospira magna]|uniref:Type IV pilus assembly protein PilQ n=1 Tax=Ectothiorhodospira magna TaxID=867345 RepID=A0A1H9B8I3_9GAMM|nr:type IV pilus secretin PilQ [Ectothiorhodospira magna]SEP85179.1 type IV pilus assembly protein PilQ [Ectothiorhodospira magna]